MIKEIKTVTSLEPNEFDITVNRHLQSGFSLAEIRVVPVSGRIVYVASLVLDIVVKKAGRRG